MADPHGAPPAPLFGLLPILRCPYCSGGFGFHGVTGGAEARAEFGLLKCSCSEFPVVDGIPVIQRAPVRMLEHTMARPETEGIGTEQLVALIRAGRTRDALMRCVAYPDLPDSWRRILGWRLSRGQVGDWLGRTRGDLRFAKQVVNRRDVASARDVLQTYYHSGGPLDPAMGHYFLQRFSQPRHLAALSIVQSVHADGSRPVLDIACGIGHLAHYLTSRRSAVPTVGVDMNFYHLWLARHWISPAARFVCADASEGLPFADDSFVTCICSDAYHYINRRDQLVREIERCAPGRTVILTRVGNLAVMPNEGKEGDLATYRSELARKDLLVFDEDTLLERYLRRQDPLADDPPDEAVLAGAKWLSFVWNPQRLAPDMAMSDPQRPHAVGMLEINPIYIRQQMPDGSIRLRFDFPIPWFAYENHAMLSYHPRQVTLSREQLRAIDSNPTDPALAELIDAFVLLGVPARFS